MEGKARPGSLVARESFRWWTVYKIRLAEAMGQCLRRSRSQKPSEKAADDEVKSQFAPDPNPAIEQSLIVEPAIRHITFWRNGFSFKDGPLLDYNDPANAKILHMLNQGQAPTNLLNVIDGQLVELQVANRTHED